MYTRMGITCFLQIPFIEPTHHGAWKHRDTPNNTPYDMYPLELIPRIIYNLHFTPTGISALQEAKI